MLQVTEEAFDKIALGVKVAVIFARMKPVGTGRNHGQCANRFGLIRNGIRVIALIG